MNKRDYIQISLPSMGEVEWEAMKQPILDGWITQGPKVREFENAFAKKHNAEHAIATTSCTSALHLMLAAAGIGPGDEVIVPSFTWIATANAVLYCGATPILCDVDPVTYNISLESILEKFSPKTKGILVVHLFGLCADIPMIRSALPRDVLIFEDCACAAGASLNGVSAGTMGVAGAFSFHPRKSITTGEGGMLTTDSSQLARKISELRNHGARISEEERHSSDSPFLLPSFDSLGFNYRMTDFQGAIGIVQLGKLNNFIAERQILALRYISGLSAISWLQLPSIPKNGQHAWQSFVTKIDPKTAPLSRDLIMRHLHENGVASRPGTHAIHMLNYYKNKYSYSPADLPGAEDCNNNTLSLPMHNRLSREDVDYVISLLQDLS